MPDTLSPVMMTQADGFVVVSWWRHADCKAVPPYSGEYSYEHFDTLAEAEFCHAEYEAGEHSRAQARGIFAVRDGLPFGPALPIGQIAVAAQEARQDRRDDAVHARHWGKASL